MSRSRVRFANAEPTDQEFFEEYGKYNHICNLWFILIFILRCFVSFCFAIQLAPFEVPSVIDLYVNKFSTENNSTDVRKSIVLHLSVLKGVGICFGGILGGVLGDLYGRRIVSLSSSVIWITLSWPAVYISNQHLFDTFYIIVVTSGTIVDLLTFVNFAELTSCKNRLLVLFTLPMFILGQLISDQVAKILKFWKYVLIFIASMNMLTVFICWYIPESPRWLMNKNKKSEAFLLLGEITGTFYEIELELSNSPILVKGFTLIREMFTHIFMNKRRNCLHIAWLMFIACVYYNCSRISIISLYVSNRESSVMIISSEFFAYVFLFPVVYTLGKRCGLFFTFLLLTVQSLISTFISSGIGTTGMYYDLFGLLFGDAAICLILVYILELFPTFFRATAMGCGACIFGLTIIPGALIIKGAALTIWYYWFLFTLGLTSMIVLVIPERSSQELPNYKLS